MQPKIASWQQNKFQLVIVSGDDKDELKAFFAEHKISAKILSDPTGKVFDQYRVQYIPSDFLVNEKGAVASSFVGWDDSRLAELEQWIMK